MNEFAGGGLPRDLLPSWVEARDLNDGRWWYWDSSEQRWARCFCGMPPEWGDEDVLHVHGRKPLFVPEVWDGRVVDLGPVPKREFRGRSP